jgi:hypothetical protein
MAIPGHKNIILNADTTKINVFHHPLIIDELGMFLFLFPLGNKRRDKINARFNCQDKARLQSSGQP